MNQQIRPEVTADKAIAAAHKNWLNARGPVTVAHEKLARYSGLTAKTAKRRTAEELREAIAETRSQKLADRLYGEWEQVAAKAAEAEQAYREEEANYTGWSRFFSVPGGHIHSTMHCGTCNRRGSMTKFVWNPELSGLTEKDAVEALGPVLCTVCFPDAPLAFTEGEKKEADEVCPGTDTMDWEGGMPRHGRISGNGGTCTHCGKWVAIRSASNLGMRKHKPTK